MQSSGKAALPEQRRERENKVKTEVRGAESENEVGSEASMTAFQAVILVHLFCKEKIKSVNLYNNCNPCRI
jgi:hypothetical protein